MILDSFLFQITLVTMILNGVTQITLNYLFVVQKVEQNSKIWF